VECKVILKYSNHVIIENFNVFVQRNIFQTITNTFESSRENNEDEKQHEHENNDISNNMLGNDDCNNEFIKNENQDMECIVSIKIVMFYNIKF